MQIVEFTADTLRFSETLAESPPAEGFTWIFVEREGLDAALPRIQDAAQSLGGSAVIDLHCRDLANATHPSHYDYTSVYDLVIFRRLATQAESQAEAVGGGTATVEDASEDDAERLRDVPPAFHHISSRAVGFVVFDRLLVSVHPRGCNTARNFIDRFLADARLSVDAAGSRNRIPGSPADLTLRMLNAMVDSYLDLRKDLSSQLAHWQSELLSPQSRFNNWGALMAARSQLHLLEDLCEEQHDALQEWQDTLREQPLSAFGSDPALARARHDQLVARARDLIEHVERVVHHVRRLEQSAETVVQIHFSAQSNRTNDIMRTLTALTAIFLPLNLITGFFGMNFEFMPLIHHQAAFWWTLALMVLIAVSTGLLFWRKRYLASRQER